MHRDVKKKIIVAKNIGFCSGVERAVKLAEETATQFGKAYTLDALLHNEEEMQRLKEKGILPLNSLNNKGEVILLPAHGSTALEHKKAEENFKNVIDTICPFVLRTVHIIENLIKENYKIAIVGDKNHREVKVLSDAARKNLLGVFQDGTEVKNIQSISKVGVVAQSTTSQDAFFSVANKLIRVANETRCFNTICKETLRRQKEAREIAKNVDCMIVIGGKTSANSHWLYEIVKKINAHSYFIQTEKDLDDISLKNCSVVGVVSGTSTPYWLTKKIIRRLGG